MFSHLPVPTLEAVAARLVPLVLAPGESVIRQGEPGDFFYIVESGRLDVTVDGRPRPSLGPGDSFGEIALMQDLPRTASVVTATAASLWSLDRETFLATITGSHRSVAKARRVAEARLAADHKGSARTTDRSDPQQ
jgi:CRP-like cAMP-binding protein